MGTYEIKVKSINLADGGSWTGPVKIYPPSVGSGNQKNIMNCVINMNQN